VQFWRKSSRQELNPPAQLTKLHHRRMEWGSVERVALHKKEPGLYHGKRARSKGRMVDAALAKRMMKIKKPVPIMTAQARQPLMKSITAILSFLLNSLNWRLFRLGSRLRWKDTW